MNALLLDSGVLQASYAHMHGCLIAIPVHYGYYLGLYLRIALKPYFHDLKVPTCHVCARACVCVYVKGEGRTCHIRLSTPILPLQYL